MACVLLYLAGKFARLEDKQMFMKRMLRAATVLGALGISVAMGVGNSHAGLELRIDYGNDGSWDVLVQDNIGTDLDSSSGSVVSLAPSGVITFLQNTGLSKPILGTTFGPEMDLHTLLNSTGATDIRIQLTDTGFSGDPNGHAQLVSIGGSLSSGAGSYIIANIYRDLDNTPFGTHPVDDFICSTDQLTPTANFGFAGSCGEFMTLDNAYSITIETILHLTGRSIVSYDAYFGLGSEIPEPASVMLLGFGVIGLGAWKLRRRIQQD
ncbi:MAG TPA: PEP-CTERM sorting domain-containing protein [Candidatus Saccharimonadales bacterium]|nr:PEP-CTERM sorting domain-containing protein [Candidatus Saccharimonadales bacterium]